MAWTITMKKSLVMRRCIEGGVRRSNPVFLIFFTEVEAFASMQSFRSILVQITVLFCQPICNTVEFYHC